MSKHIYHDAYGNELTESDALDANGIIKDGVAVRVRLEMRDSSRGHLLVDSFGKPFVGRTGYVFMIDDDAARRREDYDFHKAELSARWKAGLEAGDQLTLAGQHLEVLGYRDSGKVVLADAAELGDTRQAAWLEYKQYLSDAWKKRPRKDGDEDEEEEEEGKKKKRKKPGDMEQELAGPLSDSEAQVIKDAAWRDYVADLENRWRR